MPLGLPAAQLHAIEARSVRQRSLSTALLLLSLLYLGHEGFLNAKEGVNPHENSCILCEYGVVHDARHLPNARYGTYRPHSLPSSCVV